jgi:hypothetical protein
MFICIYFCWTTWRVEHMRIFQCFTQSVILAQSPSKPFISLHIHSSSYMAINWGLLKSPNQLASFPSDCWLTTQKHKETWYQISVWIDAIRSLQKTCPLGVCPEGISHLRQLPLLRNRNKSQKSESVYKKKSLTQVRLFASNLCIDRRTFCLQLIAPIKGKATTTNVRWPRMKRHPLVVKVASRNGKLQLYFRSWKQRIAFTFVTIIYKSIRMRHISLTCHLTPYR